MKHETVVMEPWLELGWLLKSAHGGYYVLHRRNVQIHGYRDNYLH